MRLDFHSPCATDPRTETLGYGSAYYSIRPELEKAVAQEGRHSLTEPYAGGDFQVYFGVPFDEFRKFYERRSERLWVYTMWESTVVTDEVMGNLEAFDGLIVPSAWCAEIFRNNGYAGPIATAPLGVRPGKWPLVERDPNRKPFRVYWQGTYIGDRKGAIETIRAFNELNLPDAELWLKLNPAYTDAKFPSDLVLPAPLISFMLERFLYFDEINDIYVRAIGQKLDRQPMHDLLAKMDLSVYPSRGEGFGLLPLEHMQTGLPVIVSDNSGMKEYIDPEFMIPLPCHERCSSCGSEYGTDFAVDQEELKAAILKVYENRAWSLEMGRRASGMVNEKWSYARTAERLIEIAESAITQTLKESVR